MSANITKRPQVAAGLAELRERDERLESLKALVGAISHDINNYLAPILGYVALIEEEVEPASLAFKYSKTLEDSARRAESAIIAAVAATQPQRRFQPKRVDFTALLNQEIDDWISGLGEGVGIHVVRELVSCENDMDEDQWRSVIRNLLKNARFALAMGGRVELRLQETTLTPQRARELGVSGESGWLFEVRDDGLGMSPEVLEKAFDPFFSTRPRNQSKGLGLTMIHSVVRMHGGQVMLESVEDKGTVARIWIPSIKTHSTRRAGASSIPTATFAVRVRAEGKKILVVDDEPMVLEVLKSFLEKCRYEVQTSTDGLQALKIFERNPKEWLLVVTDLTMPIMGGIELVSRIRAQHPETRVLFVSGDATASQSSKLNQLLPDVPPLLKKPFTLKALSEAVRGLVGEP